MMVIGAVIAHNLRNVDVCAQLFCAIMGSARNLRNGDSSLVTNSLYVHLQEGI